MPKFQIRDATFGLALIDAETARDALLAFVADLVKGELRPTIELDDDGNAAVEYRGLRYHAIPAIPRERL